jgi:hypothetical protein
MIQPLITANVRFLDQASALLSGLDTSTYTLQEDGGSSVGAHLRHILDHYSAFVSGVSTGEVDYDARARDLRIEENVDAAGALVADPKGKLLDLPENLGDAVKIRMDHGGPDIQLSQSSPQRELQFLISHTVHHFALIKSVLRGGSTVVEADFGVAPSTLSYRSGSACAR